MLLWVQFRETLAPDVSLRLDHERKLRVATEEREAAAPQVQTYLSHTHARTHSDRLCGYSFIQRCLLEYVSTLKHPSLF